MYSGRTKTLRAILVIAAVSAVLWTTATWSQDALKPVVKAAESSDKELEPAVAKAREGRVDEALGMIKEKAAKHPEWPPEQVILARTPSPHVTMTPRVTGPSGSCSFRDSTISPGRNCSIGLEPSGVISGVPATKHPILTP